MVAFLRFTDGRSRLGHAEGIVVQRGECFRVRADRS